MQKSMEIKVKRRYFADTYTIGTMYVDGERFCDTLEDRYRDMSKEPKVTGQTAIPYGTYKLVVNRSPKFGRDLPRLLGVPHFDGILIHRGNSPADTSGCILVGENRVKGRVVDSTRFEARLVELLKAAQERGELITITIE